MSSTIRLIFGSEVEALGGGGGEDAEAAGAAVV